MLGTLHSIKNILAFVTFASTIIGFISRLMGRKGEDKFKL